MDLSEAPGQLRDSSGNRLAGDVAANKWRSPFTLFQQFREGSRRGVQGILLSHHLF